MGCENNACHSIHVWSSEDEQGRAKQTRNDDGLSGLLLAKCRPSRPARETDRQTSRTQYEQIKKHESTNDFQTDRPIFPSVDVHLTYTLSLYFAARMGEHSRKPDRPGST